MSRKQARRRLRSWVTLLAICLCTAAQAQSIPAPKLEQIKQAISVMKLDQRIQGMVAQRVEAKVQSLRLGNPEMTDSLAGEARGIIAAVYAANMGTHEGRHDDLMPRVYAVLDRHLTAEDLKFATEFRSSDQGKRYRELVPRIVQESLAAGREWAERLEPEIRQRLEERLKIRVK